MYLTVGIVKSDLIVDSIPLRVVNERNMQAMKQSD
jgi:hypothetical protein